MFGNLSSTWTIPIAGAPMAYVGGGELAKAISATGALGVIGFGSGHDSNYVHTHCTTASEHAYGAAFMAWALHQNDDPFYAALEHDPDLICLSFGDFSKWSKVAHQRDIPVVTQIGRLADVEPAMDAGVDAIVVRGMEAGGHGRNDVALLPLLSATKKLVNVPIIAAGGIATPSDVKAVLAAGAIAAWVGTRFMTAAEAMTKPHVRAQLKAATCDDTVYTHVYDIAKKLDWPSEFGGRALRSDFIATWENRLDELAAHPEPIQVQQVYAGQGVGYCGEPESAADIVASLMS